MQRHLATWLLLVCFGFVPLAGCSSCEGCAALDRNVESFVDVPANLEELDAWASERGLEAETGMLEPQTGGVGGCGHSAACVILIPILLVDAAMPPTVKRGSVTDASGAVLFTGAFDLRGRLLRALVRTDESTDTYREIARLSLDELGENPIVEIARVRVDAEGNELERTATPLRPQVDLVARYDAALRAEPDASDRADLVVEELQQLGSDGLDAVAARYAALETVDDEELVDALRVVCGGRTPGAELLVRVTAEKGGPEAAIEAVPCLRTGTLDASHFTAIVPVVLTAACAGPFVGRALPATISLGGHLPALVAEHATRCTDEVRRAHLLFHAGQRPDDAMLERVLREDSQASLLVGLLTPTDDDDRRVLIAAMDAPAVSRAIARRLDRETTAAPTDEELARALAVFAALDDSMEAPNTRQHLLRWLSAAGPERTRPHLGPLRAHANHPANAAALVCLGEEREYLAAAAVGARPDRIRWHQVMTPTESFNDDTFVAYALLQAGCVQSEIDDAARAAARGAAPVPCAGW